MRKTTIALAIALLFVVVGSIGVSNADTAPVATFDSATIDTTDNLVARSRSKSRRYATPEKPYLADTEDDSDACDEADNGDECTDEDTEAFSPYSMFATHRAYVFGDVPPQLVGPIARGRR
jgi:hypothetical protein